MQALFLLCVICYYIHTSISFFLRCQIYGFLIKLNLMKLMKIEVIC